MTSRRWVVRASSAQNRPEKKPKHSFDDPDGGEEEGFQESEADQEQSASGVDAAFQAPPSEDEWLMPISNGTDPSEVRGITMPANADNFAEQVRRADQTSGKGCSSSSQVHAVSRHETSGGRPPDQAHLRDEAPP